MQKIEKIIQVKLREKGFSVSEFARRINTNRNNVYDIFNRESIDTELLKKISDVLEYNFFVHFLPDRDAMIVSEELVDYTNINKKSEQVLIDSNKEIAYLKQLIEEKNKIISLLENQIQML